MTSPIIVALIAAGTTIGFFYASGRIRNRYARGAAQLGSALLGLVLAGALSPDTTVARLSGEYYFYMVVVFAVVAAIGGRLFGGKRDDGKQDKAPGA